MWVLNGVRYVWTMKGAPDAPFGALQLGRVELPSLTPVDGRHGHRQVRTFDPDPAGDLLGRPALPHDQPRDEPASPASSRILGRTQESLRAS